MPAGGALFGSGAAGPGSTGGNKHLIEVKAGKMFMKGRCKLRCWFALQLFGLFSTGVMVHPEKRKGLIYIYQSEESLMHFCWQDRTTGNWALNPLRPRWSMVNVSGTVEDDLIIFPDDCEYVKVPQCTTGRVYLLKFKSSNRRFFFWLQVSVSSAIRTAFH